MLYMPQIRFRPGNFRWGSSRRSPRPPSLLGRGIPPPHSPPPSTPMASRSRRPEFHFPKVGNPSCNTGILLECYYWLTTYIRSYRGLSPTKNRFLPKCMTVSDIAWNSFSYLLYSVSSAMSTANKLYKIVLSETYTCMPLHWATFTAASRGIPATTQLSR